MCFAAEYVAKEHMTTTIAASGYASTGIGIALKNALNWRLVESFQNSVDATRGEHGRTRRQREETATYRVVGRLGDGVRSAGSQSRGDLSGRDDSSSEHCCDYIVWCCTEEWVVEVLVLLCCVAVDGIVVSHLSP